MSVRQQRVRVQPVALRQADVTSGRKRRGRTVRIRTSAIFSCSGYGINWRYCAIRDFGAHCIIRLLLTLV